MLADSGSDKGCQTCSNSQGLKADGSSTACENCPAGQYFDGTSGSGCVYCKPGSYRDANAANTATSKCTPCDH